MVSIIMIAGMSAVHAKRAVFTALAGVEGIASAEVELGRAIVEHDEGVDHSAIVAAIGAAGYAVTSVEQVRSRALPLYDGSHDPSES